MWKNKINKKYFVYSIIYSGIFRLDIRIYRFFFRFEDFVFGLEIIEFYS